MCTHMYMHIHVHIHIHLYMYIYMYLHSLLHVECLVISISNLNLIGPFSTDRGKRDLED